MNDSYVSHIKIFFERGRNAFILNLRIFVLCCHHSYFFLTGFGDI